MPVVAPTPQQPSPVEIANWQTGRTNARQQYTAGLAQADYGRGQTNLANQINQRQMGFNNAQQRQGFDDPYIARGIFNSGIRREGLGNLYTQQANQAATSQQQYLAAMGQYDLNDLLAMQGRDTSLTNIDLQEQARRAELAAQIKGII